MSDRTKQEKSEKRIELWKHHLKEWAKSGLTQNAYCRENNLKPNRFTYWKNKFKKQNLPVEFIQVPPMQVAGSNKSKFENILRLNIDIGFQVEIPDGFSQVTLDRVLQVIRRV